MKPHPILADIGKLVHCIHPALKGICRAHEDHEDFWEFTARLAHTCWWNGCSFARIDKLSQGTS
jgi:hypothetical protein